MTLGAKRRSADHQSWKSQPAAALEDRGALSLVAPLRFPVTTSYASWILTKRAAASEPRRSGWLLHKRTWTCGFRFHVANCTGLGHVMTMIMLQWGRWGIDALTRGPASCMPSLSASRLRHRTLQVSSKGPDCCCRLQNVPGESRRGVNTVAVSQCSRYEFLQAHGFPIPSKIEPPPTNLSLPSRHTSFSQQLICTLYPTKIIIEAPEHTTHYVCCPPFEEHRLDTAESRTPFL